MDAFHGTSFLPKYMTSATPSASRLEPGSVTMCALPPQAPAAVVTNWTVTEPGATKAPTSNDYDTWNMDQLRKECTARDKKIKRNIEDEGGVRRCWLRENDLVRRGAGGARAQKCGVGQRAGVDHQVGGQVVGVGQQFESRVVGVGQQAGVGQYAGVGRDLGVRRVADVSQNVGVGREAQKPAVHKPAANNSVQAVHVIAPDAPAGVVSTPGSAFNSAAKINQDQIRGKATSAKRVRQESDHNNTASRATTPPPLTTFAPPKPTDVGKLSPDKNAAVAAPASLLMKTRDVSEVLDCLSKTYALWIQLQTTANDMEGHGHQVPMLRQSIELFETGLGALEQEYAAAMGLEMPKKKARTAPSTRIQ